VWFDAPVAEHHCIGQRVAVRAERTTVLLTFRVARCQLPCALTTMATIDTDEQERSGARYTRISEMPDGLHRKSHNILLGVRRLSQLPLLRLEIQISPLRGYDLVWPCERQQLALHPAAQASVEACKTGNRRPSPTSSSRAVSAKPSPPARSAPGGGQCVDVEDARGPSQNRSDAASRSSGAYAIVDIACAIAGHSI